MSTYEMGRSLGYIYHNPIGIVKFIWYIAPIISCIGVINNWFSSVTYLLIVLSSIDAGVDIIGLALNLLWITPSQTVLPASQVTWVSKWSLLKHGLSDQWHLSSSLIMNVIFIVGYFSFFFVNEPITAVTRAVFIGYHFLFLMKTMAMSLVLMFTGYTNISCDKCGPYTVDPQVECESGKAGVHVHVESDNSNMVSAPNAPVQSAPMERPRQLNLFSKR